jgi:His-Xaa-Ser system protein HxsD
MSPDIKVDILGEFAKLSLSLAVYSEASVFKTAYWLTDRCYLFLDIDSEKRWVVEIRRKPGSNLDLGEVASEFCNSLIDFRLRDIVNTETSGIREALVRHAFLEGVPKSGLEGAISNERHLAIPAK